MPSTSGYDTTEELALINELWPLVSLRLNFFTPTKKPLAYATTDDGHGKRLYDKPATPRQRVLASRVLTHHQATIVATRIQNINPADLTRQINQIQLRLTHLAKPKTQATTTSRRLNLAFLKPSIRRLQTTK